MGFDLISGRLGSDEIVLAVADTPQLRSRGLMGVSDLGDVDGMLFGWGGDLVNSRFVMRDTLIPLTIAFFGSDGVVVDVFGMQPCDTEPCETYPSAAPYTHAVEFPGGRVVPPGTRLSFDF